MTTSPYLKMTVGEALSVAGIDAHDRDMRIRFQTCFVCGAPMNFMRLYADGKRYCDRHDRARGKLAEAIRVLNGD